jgi:hypothetical protein
LNGDQVEDAHVKQTIRVLACAVVLVVSLAACGGDQGSALPLYTGGSAPATTDVTRPVTSAPTASAKGPAGAGAEGPAALAAHSTYTYGGLTVVVNLPADLPAVSRPRVQLFSEVLQAVGRTTVQNKLDPSLSRLATEDVLRYVRTFVEVGSVQGIGQLTFRITSVHTVPNGPTLVSGCADQSELVQVRKDGSHYVDANVKKYPVVKMSGQINPGNAGPRVSLFSYSVGTC